MHKAATYYLETFGCQMNVLDSQLVEGALRRRGLRPVTTYREADVVLFNTCSVRQHAEDKVLSRLGQLKRHKQRRPETVIGVIGCMAEREKEGLFLKAPHVDLLCGPGELNRLPALLEEVWERHEQVTALAGSLSRRTEVLQRALEADSLEALDLSRAAALDAAQSEAALFEPTASSTSSVDDSSTPSAPWPLGPLQSYIRVQRGCDKFCTYCVVPFTRGPERSRPPGHIVEEAKMLADRGCREVTLLGQTVNSYVHQEDGKPVRFAHLLERIHEEAPGIDRIRFVTSFPADWDEDIFRVMRDYPRVMPYLHIPAQSGSDRILKAMRRTYTAGEYLKLMDTARRYLPEISLAGDFIVGFCGETDDDFQQTVDLVRRVQYKSLFVFKYSPRPGTAADRNQPDDIPQEVKARRNNELLAVQAEIGLKHKQALVGRTVEVLVEGYSKFARRAAIVGNREGGTGILPVQSPTQESEQDRGSEISREKSRQLVGRTPGDLIVVFDGEPAQIGALVNVRVESVSPLTLFGRLEAVVSPVRERPKPTEQSAPVVGFGKALPILAGH